MKHGPSRSNPGSLKTLAFNKAAKRDLLDLPAEVDRTFGHPLLEIQRGLVPSIAKVLKGFGGADVLELRRSDPAGTYRTVYTVRFSDRFYVLHAFPKKSHKWNSTDKDEIELIKARLKWAEAEDARWRAGQRVEP